MTDTVWVALITSVSPIAATVATLWVTRSNKLRLAWRKDKLERYEELLDSLSCLAIDGEDWDEANIRFAKAATTLALVAPQYVVTALMEFHDEIKFSNENKTQEGHDERLNRLLMAIRRDIGTSIGDNARSFSFHFIGARPPEVSYAPRINKKVRC
jgi:hypothetical protein